NRNSVPFDPRPPMVTSGLRIGTPALATRGFSEAAFAEVAEIIAQTLIAGAQGNTEKLPELKQRVLDLAQAHPLYPNLKKIGE
ncbi:serine hydroxymethyltransferase, partial [Glutamicibacter sp. MCAF14]